MLNGGKNIEIVKRGDGYVIRDEEIAGPAIAVIGGLALIWWLLPWGLAAGFGGAGYFAAKKSKSVLFKDNRKHQSFTLLMVAFLSITGFVWGKSIKGEFDSPAPAVVEEVKEVEEAKPLTYVDQTGKTVVDNQDNFRLLPDGSKVWY